MEARKIFISENIKPIKIEFSDNDTYFGDTVVKIYDDFKISLVLTDDCGAVIGDKIFLPKRGDILIFRPNEVHFGRFPNQEKYKFASFYIPIDFCKKVFSNSNDIISPFMDNSEGRLNLISPSGEYRKKIIEIANELFDIKDNYDILIFCKLIEALDLCRKCYLEQKNHPYTPTVPTVVIKAIHKINECFPDFIGLKELSKISGCSITYLTQMFRKYTGKSIHNYLTERRLESARRMLENGKSVTEACYLNGFSDCSNFIVLFKKRFNFTPGKYKKVNANKNNLNFISPNQS